LAGGRFHGGSVVERRHFGPRYVGPPELASKVVRFVAGILDSSAAAGAAVSAEAATERCRKLSGTKPRFREAAPMAYGTFPPPQSGSSVSDLPGLGIRSALNSEV